MTHPIFVGVVGLFGRFGLGIIVKSLRVIDQTRDN